MSAELAARHVRRQVELERELALDPRVFAALRDAIPEISGAWVWPKRGHAQNELTKFRYDAILEVRGKRREVPAVECRPAAHLAIEQIATIARKAGPGVVALQAVANARVCQAARAWSALQSARKNATVADVRRAARR